MADHWDQLCAWTHFWYSLFAMGSVVLVLAVVSAFIAPRGSGAYYLALLNLALLVPTNLGLLYVLKRCRDEKR